MDKQFQHIDQSVREKFDSFAPTPPAHIWGGIQQGLAAQTKPGFFAVYGKQLAVAASILLLGAIGVWWFMPNSGNGTSDEISEIGTNNKIEDNTLNTETSDIKVASNVEADTDINSEIDINTVSVEKEAVDSREEKNNILADDFNETSQDSDPDLDANSKIVIISSSEVSTKSGLAENQSNSDQSTQNIESITSMSTISMMVDNETETSLLNKPFTTPDVVFEKPKPANRGWSSGVYITPEFMLKDFDSVELLPTYSINYEPTYHVNNHFFIRFGLGLSYARDRGFAKVDYISNDVVGTYENVYDITFDSVDGELVPTYYTKTTEVWDSVRHLQVSEVTNKYLYAQTPLLFGYYKKTNRLNWYFYGGPAVNILVSKWVEEPQNDLSNVDIIDLENNLPERSPYNIQLWVGAGIEYQVAKNTAIAIEPNYRYYFNNVFKEDKYKSALSSFSLRFGVVFTMK